MSIFVSNDPVGGSFIQIDGYHPTGELFYRIYSNYTNGGGRIWRFIYGDMAGIGPWRISNTIKHHRLMVERFNKELDV